MDETSQPIEVLSGSPGTAPGRWRRRLEDQKLHDAIRSGALKSRATVPSTRDLARQLVISRRVAVDAYEQLAAEGYLAFPARGPPTQWRTQQRCPLRRQWAAARVEPRPRYDSPCQCPRRVSVAAPGLAALAAPRPRRDHRRRPRLWRSGTAWNTLPGGLGGLPRTGTRHRRRARTRRCHVRVARRAWDWSVPLAATGPRTIALDKPSNPDQRVIAVRAGLPAGPARRRRRRTPRRPARTSPSRTRSSSPPPTSTRPAALLSGERRTALIAWLRTHDAIAIEDDYDADYRYDRAAVGALQGLQPQRVVYAGSASKTLAPGAAARLARRATLAARSGRQREAARRPRNGPYRPARFRRLPRRRRTRPAPAPHASQIPHPSTCARRHPRRRGPPRRRRARHPSRAPRHRRTRQLRRPTGDPPRGQAPWRRLGDNRQAPARTSPTPGPPPGCS